MCFLILFNFPESIFFRIKKYYVFSYEAPNTYLSKFIKIDIAFLMTNKQENSYLTLECDGQKHNSIGRCVLSTVTSPHILRLEEIILFAIRPPFVSYSNDFLCLYLPLEMPIKNHFTIIYFKINPGVGGNEVTT